MPQHKTQHAINSLRLLVVRNLSAGGFKKLTVFDARRTGSFARATAEASIYVSFERLRIGLEPSFLHRPHQVDTPARTIVLVGSGDVRRTSFQTQPTVNAGENFFFFAGEY